MKYFTFIIFTSVLFCSCSSSDEDVVAFSNEFHYVLKSMESADSIDLNRDGIERTDLFQELEGFFHSFEDRNGYSLKITHTNRIITSKDQYLFAAFLPYMSRQIVGYPWGDPLHPTYSPVTFFVFLGEDGVFDEADLSYFDSDDHHENGFTKIQDFQQSDLGNLKVTFDQYFMNANDEWQLLKVTANYELIDSID